MTRDPVAAWASAVIIGSLGLALCLSLGRRYGVVGIALIAIGLRAARGLQLLVQGDLNDAAAYDNFGKALAASWSGAGPDPGEWLGKDGFPAMLGAIYWAVGHAPEAGYSINAVAAGLTVIVVASTTAAMGWERAVRPAAWLVALWPIGIIWGGALLRESVVTLLLAVASWGAVRLYLGRYLSAVMAIASSGLAMIFMRGGLAFLVLAGIPLTAALVANLRRATVSRWIVGIGVLAVAFSATFLLSGYFEGSQLFQYRAEVIADTNQGTSSFGQAGLAGQVVSQSVSGHLLRIPVTAFGPLPWQVTNLSLAQALVDAVLWLLVWSLAIFATVRLRPRVEGMLFLIPTAALIVALAANAGNFGLIIRLRGQAIALIAPLAALGLVYWLDRRAERRARREERLSPIRSRPPAPSGRWA